MLELPSSEIHLWHLDLGPDPDTNLAGLDDMVPGEELERYRGFQCRNHARRFLAGRLLVRTTLSRYAATAPAEWRFIENPYGKPAIDPAQRTMPLYFNLSHSRDRLVLALSALPAIGVDIEAAAARPVTRIAARYFAPGEVKALLALPEAAQAERFYELWTLKEAYIKARGLGLVIPLRQVNYEFPGQERLLMKLAPARHDDPRRWQCWQLDPDGPFKLALAVKSGEAPVSGIESRRLSLPDRVSSITTNILTSWNRPD